MFFTVMPPVLFACLIGFRFRSLLLSPIHQYQLLTIPHSRPAFFDALAVLAIRLAFAAVLVIALYSQVYRFWALHRSYSMVGFDASYMQELMILAGAPGAGLPTSVPVQFLLGFVCMLVIGLQFIKLLLGKTLLIFCLTVIFVRVRQGPKAVLLAALFIGGWSLLSLTLLFGFGLMMNAIFNAFSYSGFSASPRLLTQLFTSTFLITIYLLLLGYLWQLCRRRFCRGPLPIESDESA